MNQHAPKSSSPLKYVLIGCGVLALLSACGIGSCIVFGGAIGAGVAGVVEAPAQQTKAFFADLRSGNYAMAYARTSATYQASHTQELFEQTVRANPALTSQTDDTISGRQVNNGIGTMSGTLSTPQGEVPVSVTLSESGGAWAIDSLVVGGAPVF